MGFRYIDRLTRTPAKPKKSLLLKQTNEQKQKQKKQNKNVLICLPQDVDHAVYTEHTSTQKSWLFILLLTNDIQLVGLWGHPIFIHTHVVTSHGLCDVREGSVIPGQVGIKYRLSLVF